jgi:hypothetical protein
MKKAAGVEHLLTQWPLRIVRLAPCLFLTRCLSGGRLLTAEAVGG